MTSQFKISVNNISDCYPLNIRHFISAYLSKNKLNMSQSELSFNSKILDELIEQNRWFPSNVYDYDEPNYKLRIKFRYFVYKTLSKEWCDIWIKNHTKGKKFITTIKKISDSVIDLPYENYLIDTANIVKEKIDNIKIHNKFLKENNVKLKEKIIKTLETESSKQDKLNYEIEQLKVMLKKKEDKLNESLTKLDDAQNMKSILIFPGVCKDIYNIFSENKCKTDLIFHKPNDITIRVVEYMKELSN